MADYIVLVKQVPDISRITDNAFDPATGTLIRSRLSNVINELDRQALALASQMKQISDDVNSKIICLTMGPPMAEEVLRYCLARGADIAVLLTDKALGGADTPATANPLAFAIRKISREILNNNGDYFITSGMQSVDGDTAQVPSQVAEELSVPCVAYVTDVKYENDQFEFTQIISGGSQVVTPRQKPAVITAAKHQYPLFATFTRTRQANRTEIVKWNAEDIKATSIGTKGSKTAVMRVFPPGKSKRKCVQVADAVSLAKVIFDELIKSQTHTPALEKQQPDYILPCNRADDLDRNLEGLSKDREDFRFLSERLKAHGISEPAAIDGYMKKTIIAESHGRLHKKSLEDMIKGFTLTEPGYSGEVWVIAEHDEDAYQPATFELIGKARQLADCLETKVGVVLAGYKIRPLAEQLIWSGADKVYLIQDEQLEQFDPAAYRKVISDCINKHQPQIVLFAATAQGRMLAPMISYRCQSGLTADCTGLKIGDNSRRGQIAILFQTRPALGGNVMATICTKNSPIQMATARPGVFQKLHPDKARTGEIVEHEVELTDNGLSLNIISTEKGIGQARFDSEIIVSGGKGMQNRDNYDNLIGTLCQSLSNTLKASVEKGASRAAVEQGFAERIHQVGQTGTSVASKLYIAVGISGAIQHMIGVANSETIVAINSDPEAPVFKQCDYYIVGTAEQIIPKLIKALQLYNE